MSQSWSELPLDLLISVFKRLSFANFGRAKSVCSTWYFASRQSSCVPKNQIPWLILFPEDNNNDNHNSCTLFNPEEEDKLYKTKDLGVEFARSYCVATYGSWLLMRDPLDHLYMMNPFSNERIMSLPPFESQLGTTKINKRNSLTDWFRISNEHTVNEFKNIPICYTTVFWIDEKTKDYIVLWGLESFCVFYAKKGDTSWNQIIPETIRYGFNMVYKDHKLYFLSHIYNFKIFDFSQEIPQQTFEDDKVLFRITLRPIPTYSSKPSRSTLERKLVVTLTGDVLKVDVILDNSLRIESFRVERIHSSGLLKKYEQVYSLGDETMILDLGITVHANKVEGLKRNCIYFSRSHNQDSNEIVIFNLETHKMERLHNFFNALWFLPTFT